MVDEQATQKPNKTQQTRSQPRQAKSPPHCAAGSTESEVNTTTPTPTPEALAIAVIFNDFAIDHTPDGWPAVKQMHLNAAAAELERQHAEIEHLTGQLAREQEARRDAQTRLADAQELAAHSGLAHRKAVQEAVCESADAAKLATATACADICADMAQQLRGHGDVAGAEIAEALRDAIRAG